MKFGEVLTVRLQIANLVTIAHLLMEMSTDKICDIGQIPAYFEKSNTLRFLKNGRMVNIMAP